jgi:hypothetical protein
LRFRSGESGDGLSLAFFGLLAESGGMKTIAGVVLCASVAFAVGGCGLGGRAFDTRSTDEQRMVYPSDPPTDGLFVAIRGSGDEIPIPADDASGELRPPTVQARPVLPPITPEDLDRVPTFIVPTDQPATTQPTAE